MTRPENEPLPKLTAEQEGMVGACIATGGAWTTAAGSENDQMLSGWVDRGWAERVPPPAKCHSLSAYRITPAGGLAILPLLSEPTP